MNRLTGTLLALVGVAGLAAVATRVIVPMSRNHDVTSPSDLRLAAVHTCSKGALSVKLGARGHAAMSSAGFAIAITNKGTAPCSLNGFATVTALTKTTSAKPITFVHSSQSQSYANVSPKTVVLAPKGTASFGISYTDNKDQQYGSATGCQMYAINVRLPGVKQSYTARISVAAIGGPAEDFVNSCFTNFKFGLTPIVAGSKPPQP